MGVASLVLGICAVVFGFWIWWLGLILGVVGLILAICEKNPAKKGVRTAGLVLNIIALASSLIVFIACAACIAASGLY